MLIGGSYQGHPASVFTGSEDFTSKGLLDDDDLWEEFDGSASNNALYAAFEANFNEMWNASLPCGVPG
jgi:hypothetical protein